MILTNLSKGDNGWDKMAIKIETEANEQAKSHRLTWEQEQKYVGGAEKT